jgi:hypothetical protein
MTSQIPKAGDADSSRCQDQGTDHAHAADEAGDGVALAASQDLGCERAEGDGAADPDHRRKEVQHVQPVGETCC